MVASSDKAYGPHRELPYREDFELRPASPYEASKAAADVSPQLPGAYGLPLAVTRFANVYGGGDLNFSRLIPETIVAVLEDRRPAIRSDGSPERDFLYVDDAVAAYLAIEHEVGAGGPAAGEAFNAGGSDPTRSRGGRADRRVCDRGRARLSGIGSPGARSIASTSTRRSCES